MFRGAIRATSSFCERSLGHSMVFWEENESCQVLSWEFAGEGGATMVSGVGRDDLTGKASCEVDGLGAKVLALNGLNGPRGRGSTRGRGGNRRSSLMSTAPTPLEDKERTLLKP